jgi:hypothetical protein
MKAKIEIEVSIPKIKATKQEAKDWLLYELGYSHSIPSSNPYIQLGESINITEAVITDIV